MSIFEKYLNIYNELVNLNTEKKEFAKFFDKAKKASMKSTCGRKHVGAAIFYWPKNKENAIHKKGKLLGLGWNGIPEIESETRYGVKIPKINKTCQSHYHELGIDINSEKALDLHIEIMKNEIHAEDRCIQNVIRKHGKKILKDSIIFTTLSPCTNCAKMISKYDIAVGGWLEKYTRDNGAGISQIKKISLTLKNDKIKGEKVWEF